MALRQALHLISPWLAAGLLSLTFYDGYHWLHTAALNGAIADGSIAAREDDLPPEAVFARAYWQGRAGRSDSALGGYGEAARQGAGPVEQAALYNAGNIYLRQALELLEQGRQELARPLMELAKANYRDALRADPTYWDAKYNLERALRLAPERGDEDGAGPPPVPGERAPTTMRGFTLGYP